MSDFDATSASDSNGTADQARTHANVERVTRAAAERGLQIVVRRFPAGTRTAQDAARAVGCHIAQIVKSLVFIADGEPVVALVSGADRVDPIRLGDELGATNARRATGDEVRATTGYVIGGVPPLGHVQRVRVVMDEGLLRQTTVWAAAGLPDVVFSVDPSQLRDAADASVGAIAADPTADPSGP
jgi:prolyl-tRNA editing enzyme YbaK/EbsC (Cys-tRNA(Pro) deacylase)